MHISTATQAPPPHSPNAVPPTIGTFARSLVACQSPNEAPEAEHDEIEHALRLRIDQDGGVDVVTPHVLDPAWGLERMIAKLVGLSAGALTPFSTQ